MTIRAKNFALLTITRKKKRQPKRTEFIYTIDNVSLSLVHKHKCLGLTITQDCKFDLHITNVTTVELRRLMFPRRRLRLAPAETKLVASKSFVRSVLDYATIVGFPFTVTQVNKLGGIQRKAIRFIYNRYRLSTYSLN